MGGKSIYVLGLIFYLDIVNGIEINSNVNDSNNNRREVRNDFQKRVLLPKQLDSLIQVLDSLNNKIDRLVNATKKNENQIQELVESTNSEVSYKMDITDDNRRHMNEFSVTESSIRPKGLLDNFKQFLPRFSQLLRDIIANDMENSNFFEDTTKKDDEQTNTIHLKEDNSFKVADLISLSCKSFQICIRDGVPVCGFDMTLGYHQFHDLCDLLRVNCYFKRNYSLVSSCRPIDLELWNKNK